MPGTRRRRGRAGLTVRPENPVVMQSTGPRIAVDVPIINCPPVSIAFLFTPPATLCSPGKRSHYSRALAFLRLFTRRID